ncbi:MAG: copper chaperone PCu(A)C [Gammaproteobacteria bacterium]|nr:MAG: copper chaperone PCu(A)C [Gammaproteobacteria bacterium]
MKQCLNALLLAAALISPSAFAHDYTHGSIQIEHPWSRPTPPGTPMGVGYMTVTNNGNDSVTLASAESPRASHISIHESSMRDGVMRMQPVSGGLAIPAGETIELKPHGYHLMLEGLREALKPGERIPVTLQFDGAESLSVELTVETLDGAMKQTEMKMEHSERKMN